MSCSLSNDLPWSALLAARELLAAGALSLAFAERRGAWTCRDGADAEPDSLLVEVEPGSLEEYVSPASVAAARAIYRTNAHGLPSIEATRPNDISLEPTMESAARVYLPILIGAARAHRSGSSFVAGHVTQTLDGRIACENGQSQWIGNMADQHHSHRMRALLDGVMVGATTALRDDPRLDVRHVSGPNPRRIVVSGRGRAVREGKDLRLMQAPGCEIFVDAGLDLGAERQGVNVHRAPAEDAHLEPAQILSKLREVGVHSVYLEGGSSILSSFLLAGNVDILQVHIAAMVLGSGLPSLRFPTVEHVDQGLQLHMDHAVLDGHVLLTCRPNPTGSR
ncbi:MAG: RibD family protein [Planctomycetota bacterium]